MTGHPTDIGPLPGTLTSEGELRELGFAPHTLRFDAEPIRWPGGSGMNWTTVGDVPDSPGVYAFTVTDGEQLHVAYVGRTTHLWMVTKGHLPRSGGARGGQRYGRPKHAGVTRKRINALIALEVGAGRTVTHWIAPMSGQDIAVVEEQLIRRWSLRGTGWNRG